MSKIAICSFGRVDSERCPNKMLRPFAETTLTDIMLEKLSCSKYPTFFGGYEPAFKEKCATHNVPFVQRSKQSVSIDEPITDILAFLREIEHSHLLLINACLPLLSLTSIEQFADDCLTHDLEPAFAVMRRDTHFVSREGKPLNFDATLKTINTKTVEPVLEFAHALYFFGRDYFFEHGRYWDWSKVRYVEVPNSHEIYDIDTEEDFLIAESIWKTKRRIRT